jgi:Fe-S cluster assembly protein SufD
LVVTMTDQQQALQTQYPMIGAGQSLRSFGQSRFAELGLPNRHQEEWHYTSLKEISSHEFELALLKKDTLATQKQDIALANTRFFNLIFIDGNFQASLSDLDGLKKEISIQEITQGMPVSVVNQNKVLKSLEALNQSYLQQGLIVEIPDEVSVSRPIQIVNLVTRTEVMCHPRLMLSLGKKSKLSLIENYLSKGLSWQNSVTEIKMAESSALEYLRMQDESQEAFNTGLTRIELMEGAALEALSFTVGAKLGRHDMEIMMLGSQSSARVQGLTLGSGEQHLDHNTLIDHVVGGCSTSQLYKSVLNQKARSVFTGMVKIRQGAQKANSDQLNNNLLLSRQAEADSRPQLEILADDVKATHGSTVGQLNAEELFYLLSRAIPKPVALEMLSLGFVQDLVFQVSHPDIQKWLEERLTQSYRQSMGGLH